MPLSASTCTRSQWVACKRTQDVRELALRINKLTAEEILVELKQIHLSQEGSMESLRDRLLRFEAFSANPEKR